MRKEWQQEGEMVEGRREEEYMYTYIAEYSLLLKIGSTSLVVHLLSPSLWEGSSESGRGAVL